MTEQTKIKYALLAEWLRTLELEGFVFGVDKQLQLQTIIEQLPENFPIEGLKLLLTPIIAQNEQAQNVAYTLFDRAWQRVRLIHQVHPSESAAQPAKKKLALLFPLVLLLAVLVGVLLWTIVRPSVTPPTKVVAHLTRTINVNVSDTICLDSTVLSRVTDLEQPVRALFFCDSNSQKDSSELASFAIDHGLCLIYNAKDQIGTDTVCVEILGQAEVPVPYYFPFIIQQDTLIDPIALTTDTSASVERPLFELESYPIKTDILTLSVPALSDWQLFFADHMHWLKTLFYVLSALLLLLILLIRERNRRALIAEKEQGTQPPNIWSIELANTIPIELGDQFDTLLNYLRQRTTADQLVFDIDRTVQATIQEAGMINFEYSYRTRPPEYLLLINTQNRDDHRAQWQDYLYHQFLEHEVLVERFFYKYDPRLCWNEKYVDGLKIKDLQQLFPESRLLVSGDAYSLLNPSTGKIAKWTKVFELWKDRAIFTPIPTSQWGRRERMLEDVFIVLPSSLQALQFYVNQLDLGTEANFDNWKQQVEDAATHPILIKPAAGHIIEQFNIHFEPPLLLWFATCCVYPALHWDLTLRLGELLSNEENQLLQTVNISQLLRLPYFETGKIPDDIRAAFVAWLEQKHPDVLQGVRLELDQLFQQNPPPKDSIAWEEYYLNAAFNELLITTDSKRKQQLEAEIATEIANGAVPDFTVVKYLNRPKSNLDFIVPENWKKYVYKGGWSGLGFKEFEKDFLWALPVWLIFCALIWWIPDISQECQGQEILQASLVEIDGKIAVGDIIEDNLSDEVYLDTNLDNEIFYLGDIDLCMVDAADYILLNEYQARYALLSGQYSIIDSLNRATDSLYKNIEDRNIERKADSLWAAYLNNLSVEYWNLAVPYWARWDSLQDLSDLAYDQMLESGDTSFFSRSLSKEEAANIQKDSACFFFGRAAALDDLNDERARSLAWCEERDYQIQISLPSASASRNINLEALKVALSSRGYRLLNDTYDASLTNSEVQYYYEADRFVANDVLDEIRTQLPELEIELVRNEPPAGPAIDFEGNIVVQLVVANNNTNPPPTVQQIGIALYAYQGNPADYNKVAAYLKSQNYNILTQQQLNRPLSSRLSQSSILYTSQAGQVEATKLKNRLAQVVPAISFQVRKESVETIKNRNADNLVLIYLQGNDPNSDLEYYSASKLVEVLITENDAQRRGLAFKFLLSKYSEDTQVIQRLLDVLENNRLTPSLQNTALSFLFSTSETAWSYQQIQQGKRIATSLNSGKMSSSEIDRFNTFMNELDAKAQAPMPNLLTAPLSLYFDPEQPELGNTDSYDRLIRAYLQQQENYINAALNSPRAVSAEQLRAEVEDFFERDVRASYSNFQQLLSNTENYLQQGYKIQFCLQGIVSDASKSSLDLANRRIGSIRRYLVGYNSGSLQGYLDSGNLVLKALPVSAAYDNTFNKGKKESKAYPNDYNPYDLSRAKSNTVFFVSVEEQKAGGCVTY